MSIISQETLRQLGGPAIIALVLVALGITALAVTDQMVKRADQELELAKSEKFALRTRMSRATDEEREIREKLVDYQRLRDHGIVGDENRLDWIETIQTIKSERKLFDVRYRIEPRRAVDYPGWKPGGEVEFMMSRMRLEALLLHEEDLVNLLGDLSSKLAPHVSIRSCRIDRTDQGKPLSATGPRLRSECTLDLITIRDRGPDAETTRGVATR